MPTKHLKGLGKDKMLSTDTINNRPSVAVVYLHTAVSITITIIKILELPTLLTNKSWEADLNVND